MSERGWWNMVCWNGLSTEQQERLIKVGNLPIGYEPAGKCKRGAEVEITTMWDEAPGPRFYCLDCAVKWLRDKQRENFSWYENFGGDEEASPCKHCGIPVVKIEWTNGIRDTEGASAFVDKNDSIYCVGLEQEDWEERSTHWLDEQ